MLDESAIKKVKWVVPGGKTGQESIYLGLKKLFAQCECPRRAVVLIHDGVRPMITPQLITENIESVRMHGSAITVAPAIETIVQTHQDGSVVGVIDRNDAFLARAPQSFFLQDLMDAHNKAIENHNLNEVDTTCLMRRYGYPLHTVPGPAENIKITTLTDYYMAKAIYERDELR
jgi:2-C-methyl-D-erythritol 4-phosphate cytidylyltransferase